jgi:hypothetical protein
MKKLWMFLGALTFVTQAHCAVPDEFEVVNNSSQSVCIKDTNTNVSRVVKSGERELFNINSFSKEDKITLSIYFGNDASKSKTFVINPPKGKITFTELFRQHFPNLMGSNS